MTIGCGEKPTIRLHGQAVENRDQFVYLGSIVDQQGGTDADVNARIKKARMHLPHSNPSGTVKKPRMLNLYCYIVQNAGKYHRKWLRMPRYLFMYASELSCALDGHRRSQTLKLGISINRMTSRLID